MLIATPERYRVGALDIAVTAAERRVHAELASFYDSTGPASHVSWRVTARLATAPPRLSGDLGTVDVDTSDRSVAITATDAIALAVTTRRVLRDLWLAELESTRYGILHASAVASPERVLIFVGDSGSGKTTLALDAVLRHNFRLISNDYLLLVPHAAGLRVSTVPTYIPVKPWTLERFDTCLSKLAPLVNQDDCTDGERYLTFRQLGQQAMPDLVLNTDSPPVEVHAVRFGSRPTSPVQNAVGLDEVAAHHRADWYLRRRALSQSIGAARGGADFAADTRSACATLVGLGSTYRWEHGGKLDRAT